MENFNIKKSLTDTWNLFYQNLQFFFIISIFSMILQIVTFLAPLIMAPFAMIFSIANLSQLAWWSGLSWVMIVFLAFGFLSLLLQI